MIFLTAQESRTWSALGRQAAEREVELTSLRGEVRGNLWPAFCYYAGALLAARGAEARAKRWFMAGSAEEEEGLFSNSFISSFIERHGGKLRMPVVCFADPAPYVHFTGVPALVSSRRNFVGALGHSMPNLRRPLRLMDIGCGDGGLTIKLAQGLLAAGKAPEVEEILLIDASPAMVEMSTRLVGAAFPKAKVRSMTGRIEALSDKVPGRYDVAICSLSYHHMPYDTKVLHLGRLKEKMDHLVLFELNADHDFPEQFSPEFIFSIYQGYGRIIDFVFAHDAPLQTAQACVDNFLMTEVASMLTTPRGVRSDYHMLRLQWHDLFRKTLSPEFGCLGDTTCYSDEYMDLFMLHYGRLDT
jgi:SAM-dependent methyltransferase